MVFASNALVTKPAISLAPMITVAIFNRYGYDLIKSGKPVIPSVSDELHDTMFHLACCISIGMGFLQLMVWSMYTIRNTYESKSKYVETDN